MYIELLMVVKLVLKKQRKDLAYSSIILLFKIFVSIFIVDFKVSI